MRTLIDLKRGQRFLLGAFVLTMGCSESSDGGSEDTDTEAGTTSSTMGQSTNPSTMSDGTNPATSNGPTSSTDPTDPDSSSSDDDPTTAPDTGVNPSDDCDFFEDFEGIADGSDWPAVWVATGRNDVADVQGGMGRLRPVPGSYALARMTAFIDCTDADAVFTVVYGDPQQQGAGLYVRNNGGFLDDTDPVGEGYATFAEGFRDPDGVAVWREVDGNEQRITDVFPLDIQANTPYRLRVRVTQADATNTLIQTKMWPASGSEPDAWMVERMDDTASLQGVGGAMAVDAYASGPPDQSPDMFFDDIEVRPAR